MEETFESGGYKLQDRDARWIEAYVRLKPGVSRAQAQEEISAIATRLENNYSATNRGRGFRLWHCGKPPFNNARTLLATLEIMVAVGAFVLLIACRECGQPAAGQVIRPSPRNDGSARHWGQPHPFVETTSYRRPDPFDARGNRRTPGCVLVPARAGAAPPDTLRSGDVPAWGNRLACDVDECRISLIARLSSDWSLRFNAQPRACRRPESGVQGGGRRPWNQRGCARAWWFSRFV